MAKQLLACMQSEVLDEHGSDCGTKKTIEVNLTAKNARDFEYRYIVDGGKYICLTPDTIQKYVGRKLRMRTPLYCKHDKICNICAGEMNYKLNLLNIGLGCSKPATTLLNLGMKHFHSSAIKSTQIDLDDALI